MLLNAVTLDGPPRTSLWPQAKPIVRSCKDSREEFGFALVGHDFRIVHAENFARCYFECSLQERWPKCDVSLEQERMSANEGRNKEVKTWRFCGKSSCHL